MYQACVVAMHGTVESTKCVCVGGGGGGGGGGGAQPNTIFFFFFLPRGIVTLQPKIPWFSSYSNPMGMGTSCM